MLKSKQRVFVAGLVLASLILAACQSAPVQVPVTVLVPQTQPVTQLQVQVQTQIVNVPVTTTPVPTVTIPKVMTICLSQEPTTLAWYKTDPVTVNVLQALYDGGIDNRNYQYQPVTYKKLPSFGDQDAGQVEVALKDGDTVYDAASGSVVTLTKGVNLTQLDGSVVAYNGSGSAKAVQLWARWTLVDGLKWEDGTPVTADDQVFTFQTDSSPDLPSQDKSLISFTSKFEALSAATTQWTGIPGYTDHSYYLHVWQPLPRHAYGKLLPAQMPQDATVNRKPLAFGPFKLDEWVAGDHITLSRNPSYWRAGEGLPRLDKIVFRFLPDLNQLLAQLAAGKCDLATQDSRLDSSLPLIKQLQAQKLMTAQVVPGTSYEHLDFNEKPGANYTGFAAKARNADGSLVFAKPEIRQALAECIDRQAVVDQAVSGAAVVQDVYVPASHPLYGGDAALAARYPFDKAAGLALLAKNGWKDTNGDGILDNGKGQDFTFILSTRSNSLRQKTTRAIQAQLKANCLIDARIELYGSEFFQTTRESIVQGMNYDVVEFAWPVGVEPPCELYISGQISRSANAWAGYDTLGYASPAYDAACLGALAAVDPASKKSLHAQAQKIFSADLPSLILFASARVAVTSPRVTGVILDSTETTELWNVENFDLSQP